MIFDVITYKFERSCTVRSDKTIMRKYFKTWNIHVMKKYFIILSSGKFITNENAFNKFLAQSTCVSNIFKELTELMKIK